MPKIIATKEDWIVLGYKQFADKGIDGLIVERMAKKLRVNKSSFYWHFTNKQAFVQAIIQYWEMLSTSKIIEQVNKASSPMNQFEKLIELSFLKDDEIDFFFYLKKYAQGNPPLTDTITRLDQQRIQFTADLLQGLGYTVNDAAIKSSIFYKYLIGYHEMIRYKKQEADYLSQVKHELSHFITI